MGETMFPACAPFFGARAVIALALRRERGLAYARALAAHKERKAER
jgi:hypothetical protein